LLDACRAAAVQHRVVAAERALLELVMRPAKSA
jgi:hypothetical protein